MDDLERSQRGKRDGAIMGLNAGLAAMVVVIVTGLSNIPRTKQILKLPRNCSNCDYSKPTATTAAAIATTATTTATTTTDLAARPMRARERYAMWGNVTVPRFDRHNSVRVMMYRCIENCGGWADRVRGAISTYLLANITGRSFKMRIKSPRCNLTHYLVPNRVDWSHPAIRQYSSSSDQVLDAGKVHNLLDKGLDITAPIRKDAHTVYFQTYRDFVAYFRNSSLFDSKFAWMKGMAHGDVYAVLYMNLFQLSAKLQSKLDALIHKHLPTPSHRLLCAHVRLGKNPSISTDSVIRNSLNNTPRLWQFLHARSRSSLDKVFIMSDSQEVIDSAQRQDFRGGLVTVSGNILHVDQADKQHVKAQAQCAGLEKVILEDHLLMNCDLLVMSKSGLSYFASYVRGTDKDLFCFRLNGTIESCQRPVA